MMQAILNPITQMFSPQTEQSSAPIASGNNLYTDARIEQLNIQDMRSARNNQKTVISEISQLSSLFVKLDDQNFTQESLLQFLESDDISAFQKHALLAKVGEPLTAILRSSIPLESLNNKNNPSNLDQSLVDKTFKKSEAIFGLTPKAGASLLERADAIRAARVAFEGKQGFIIQDGISAITKGRTEAVIPKALYTAASPLCESTEGHIANIEAQQDTPAQVAALKDAVKDILTQVKANTDSSLAFVTGVKDFDHAKSLDKNDLSLDNFYCIADLDNCPESREAQLVDAFKTATQRYFVKGYHPMLPATGIHMQARPQHKGLPFDQMMRTNGMDQQDKRLTVYDGNAIDIRVGRKQTPFTPSELASLMKTAKEVQKLFDFAENKGLTKFL